MKTPGVSRVGIQALFCIVLAAGWALGQSATPAPGGAPPLYMLTYDHGGLILWGGDHFRERLRDAVSWLDKYPDFKIGLDNEAHTYDLLAERDPEVLAELRDLLKRYQGRLGIGTCTYGQPLSQFINEESNIRQIAYAIEADQRHFGYTPSIYLMSEHAMHSQIPQILKGFGFKAAIMRTHFMMYGYNPTYDAPIGWWVGLDGSTLPAFPTYRGQGAQFAKTTVDNWILTRYPGSDAPDSLNVFRERFKNIQPLLATRADDSGLRKEALVREYSGNPSFRWLLLEDLLSVFPKPEVRFETRPNDFVVRMPWGYCGNEIWNRSREAEVRVLTAERLAALESMLGGANRESDLREAWKNLLVGQHHDVQIVGLLPDARRFLSASLQASSRVQNASLQSIARRMKGEGFSQVTVFNPVSWRRKQWIETRVTLGREQAKALAVKSSGRPVPSALIHADRFSSGHILDARLAFLADVPGLGLASYSIVPADAQGERDSSLPTVEWEPADLRIRTPYWEVMLDPRGGFASVVDRVSGKPAVAPGKRSVFFAGRIDGKDCESQGQWGVERGGEEANWMTAREQGVIGPIPYTLEIVFRPDTPRLECRVEFQLAGQKIGQVSEDRRDWLSAFVHEHKLRLKVFPEMGEGPVGVRDLPFAVAETPERYVEGNYWTAVAGRRGGLAFLNRGTMGAVREANEAFSLPLAHAMYYVWGTRMLRGRYGYEFALRPFVGEWRQADLHREAVAYNFPMVAYTGQPGDGSLGDHVRPVRTESDTVLLSALYPKEGAVVARFYESTGQPGLLSSTNLDAWQEVDLSGRPAGITPGRREFGPWQFRTFVLEPNVKAARR